MSVPAGARYQARRETAAESRALNDSGPAEPRSAPAPAESAPADSGGSTGRTGPRIGAPKIGSSHSSNYQAIILAEFVAAELLVAMTPIAARKNQPGLSPYVPRDMTKLLAIGMVYFLLELAAVTGSGAGRFGAWFGLIVLMTVGLNEAANVTKVLDLFAPGSSTASSDDDSSDDSGSPFDQNVAGEVGQGLNPFGGSSNG